MKGLLFLFICSIHSLFASGPIMHTLIANKFHEVSGQDKESFLRGTLFPDIRYIAKIPRSSTHEKNVSLQDILKTKNAFQAGKKLHSFVDATREKFITEEKTLSHLSHFGVPKEHADLFLKFLEDEICFSFTDVRQAIAALKTIDKGELEVSEQTVQKWHTIQIEYLTSRPSVYLQKNNHGISQEIVKKWIQLLPKLAKDPFFQEHTQKIIQLFHSTLLLAELAGQMHWMMSW